MWRAEVSSFGKWFQELRSHLVLRGSGDVVGGMGTGGHR